MSVIYGDVRGHCGSEGGSRGGSSARCGGSHLLALLCLSSSVCVRPQGKLVKYFSRQLSCKRKVALEERSAELEDFPRLGHWFRIVNLRKEVTQVTLAYPYKESFFFLHSL